MNAQTIPAAFLSYPSEADQDSFITELRAALEREVRLLTGERSFQIFQDRNMTWGESWQARIDSTLDATTFLIPVIQPLFFSSDACRDELTRFLEREQKLGRNDLILPLYYITVRDFGVNSADPLVKAIASRQSSDVRQLRVADELTKRRLVIGLGERFRDALHRVTAPPPGPARQPAPAERTPAPGSASGSTEAERLDALVKLLLSMFSSDEFTRFLRYNDATAAICNLIPGPSSAPAVLFHEAGVALMRQDLVDTAFFQRLEKERPRRAPEIRRVSALFGEA